MKPLAKLFGIGAGLVLAAAVSAPAAGRLPLPPRPPNIIFILADDLGYGELGCYGQKKILTPNLDRLAAEGMRFTQCYAGSTVCAPSRSTLMTGQHTGHTRVRGNSAAAALRAEDVTVAELLQRAGYRTGLIGKWGLGLEHTDGTPNKKGFEDFVGFLDQTHAHQYYPTNIWRNDAVWLLDRNANGLQGQYIHDLFARAGNNFVRVSKNFPFFLYLAYTVPHANNELGKKTGNGLEVPDDTPYAKETWPPPEKNKAAMITRLDADVGRLLDHLKALKLETNTVIFFSSDNGPHSEGGVQADFFNAAAGRRGLKRDLYEGGLRVPMIVRWPGQIKPGVVSDFPWAFWDFLPTAAEIAGVKTPPGLDGVSVLPVLLGQEAQPHAYFYWEFHEGASKQAVRMGNWKAVRLAPGRPLELYDLMTDPAEAHDVAAKNPDVLAKVEVILKTARTESKEWPLRAPGQPVKAGAKSAEI